MLFRLSESIEYALSWGDAEIGLDLCGDLGILRLNPRDVDDVSFGADDDFSFGGNDGGFTFGGDGELLPGGDGGTPLMGILSISAVGDMSHFV